MGVKGAVTFKGQQYRYILTVEDVLNCFVCLRPLKVKSILLVYKKSKRLEIKHGPSLVLQCDHGAEPKGAVKRHAKKRLHHNTIGSSSPPPITREGRNKPQAMDLMQLVGHGRIN